VACKGQGAREGEMTYADNGWVIGHSWRLVLLDRARAFLDPQVLHIFAAKDDVFVNLVARSCLVVASTPAPLSTVRPNVLQRDGGLVRVDFM
jgi:hypothetical protein